MVIPPVLGHNTFHPNSLLYWHCGLSHCWSVGIGDGNMNDQEAHRHPTMKEVHAADQLRNLSLSGSLFLSFSLSFFLFFTNARQATLVGTSACSALGVTTTFCQQIWLSESTTLSPLRPVRPRYPLYSFGFPAPGFHNTFSAHLGPFNSIGQNLHHKIYTRKCKFFTRIFVV